MSSSIETALNEREGIISYLRRKALDCRRRADRLLAGAAQQNKSTVEGWETEAEVYEALADEIFRGAHWIEDIYRF